MPTENLRAAMYARVSSDHQADAGTIRSQIEAVTERAKQDGLIIDEDMKFIDEGFSGSTLVRPALEKLRDLAAVGAMDRLYVHCPDRLSRKYAYQVLLVEELERCGVELVFLNQDLGQTPEQRLLLQVQGVVAEYERAAIRERSRRGKRHAARRGSINVLSRAPYGYRYITKDEGAGAARYDVILPEAQIVRQLFEWVGQERLSLGEVCRRLERQGVPTRTGNSQWNSSTVRHILRNSAYTGQAAFGRMRTVPLKPRLRPARGHSGRPKRGGSVVPVPKDQWVFIPVPALVSDDLFNAVQEQLEENRKRCRWWKQGPRHLLQGLVVCQQCGYALCARHQHWNTHQGERRRRVYYRCIGRDKQRFGGQAICSGRPIRGDQLEQEVWDDVRAMLAEPERIQQEYTRRVTKENRPQDTGPARRAAQSTKRAMSRITDAYEGGWLEREDFEKRMQRAQERLGQLQAEVDAQIDAERQEHELRLAIDHLGAFANRVAQGLDQADWASRRELICALVREVRVADQSVRIVYRVQPTPRPMPTPPAISQDCCRRTCVIVTYVRARPAAVTRTKLLHVQHFATDIHDHLVVVPMKDARAARVVDRGQRRMAWDSRGAGEEHFGEPARRRVSAAIPSCLGGAETEVV